MNLLKFFKKEEVKKEKTEPLFFLTDEYKADIEKRNKVLNFLFDKGYREEVYHGHSSYERYVLNDYCINLKTVDGSRLSVYERVITTNKNPYKGRDLTLVHKGDFEGVKNAHNYILQQIETSNK